MKAKKWLGEGIVNQKGTKHEALKNSQPIHIGEKKLESTFWKEHQEYGWTITS